MADLIPQMPMANGAVPGSVPQGEITNANPMVEIGVTGLKQASGFLWEEYLPQLRGRQGIRLYQEMSQNDPTVGAILRAFKLMIKSVDWKVTAADDTPEMQAEGEFVESILDDMSETWGDFISEVLTMLSFGWSFHEVVYKLRAENGGAEPSRRSKYPDGRIGIRKLAPRAQDSLLRWEMKPQGGLLGIHQLPPIGGGIYYIPIERGLLFRTVVEKGSPEGVSVLRNAYRPWYLAKTIEEIEAIGIERDLVGLPVVSIPSRYLTSLDPKDVAVKQSYEKIARDLKFNSQSGVVKPSDVFTDPDGKLSSVPMVDIKLMTSGGSRTLDIDKALQRHQRNIAKSVLAMFLTVGEGSNNARGSTSQHQSTVDYFDRACESIVGQIADPINRYMLPRLWAINNLPPETMPKLTPGKVAPQQLDQLGQYLADMATAGVLTPSPEVENFAREAAGMPMLSDDGTV